jgi:hypothetical protein
LRLLPLLNLRLLALDLGLLALDLRLLPLDLGFLLLGLRFLLLGLRFLLLALCRGRILLLILVRGGPNEHRDHQQKQKCKPLPQGILTSFFAYHHCVLLARVLPPVACLFPMGL